MRRLYTAFVSSTFLDLQAERQRLVSLLLDQRCVPLGMEFFPSAGQTQWPIITDSIEAADFCIFVIAGRYGSISDNGLSWTHREFREAVRQGKPIAAVLHAKPNQLPATKRDHDPQLRQQLESFRAEVQASTLCRFFEDEADLVRAVASSLSALREDPRVMGWIRNEPDRVTLRESDFDRVYEEIEIVWRFVRSTYADNAWDGLYRGRRRMVANDPNGVHRVAHDFTRDTDSQLPFDQSRFPLLTVTEFQRTGPGTAQLVEPRKHSGSTFVQDLEFSPPMSTGETADWTLEGLCPAFKYATAEGLLEATVNSRLGARAFDWTSRRIVYPTRRLSMTVYLPLALGATPRGPIVSRGSSYIDHELSAEAARDGAYAYELVEYEGAPCHKLTLELENPPMQRYYRLAWNLP